ncbi:head GIN domain-containing protein [Flavobacterium buctense]|uniref:Head GIN domain-containing protein n=1 Tax=Flavobacterium buctense TaxID=1648146 RepID=A0ABU9E1V9_9FLAO|nr:head GIN domain-containing protein [Flavobacterium buctense]
MTKLVIFFSKVIAATLVALSITSCDHNINFGKTISGSGKVITEKRNLANFDKVTVSSGLDCEVIYSDQSEVIVEADDNLVNGIKTNVENGTLEITSEYNNYNNVKSKKIIVRMPKIVSLESTSGSTLKSGNILNSEDITLKSSSGSSLEVEVEADKVTLETSSGSEQKITGKALKVFTASSSGSHLDANGLLANEVKAQSSSGSSTTVSAALLLDAKASSGSSITYLNSPKEVRKEESSGGSVSKD